jgi:formyltetrahydrofolate deformylase
VIANHATLAPLAERFDVPFHHVDHNDRERTDHEHLILELLNQYDPEFIVLAKYMRTLSPEFVTRYASRIINIHHSFLPAFSGAKPYRQAFERGVKIIGATAHFVTADLDEGPIIEQRVTRVDHTMDPKELTREGSIIESQVLATAVRWYAQKRVFLDGAKTVVFN